MEPKDFTIGQDVFCFSFGSWYPAKVEKVGRTRLHVTYTTGSGMTRTKDFPMNKISLEHTPNTRTTRRRRAWAPVGEPEMVERKIQLSNVECVSLLCAFQVLKRPSTYFHRTCTHTRSREIVQKLIGIKLRRSAKPPENCNGLEEYVEWASNPKLQEAIEPEMESA